MVGIGTLVNFMSIIVGGAAGTFVQNGLSERFKKIITQAVGLAVLVVGLSGALQGIYKISESGQLTRENIMLMIFSLVIGGIIGESINIELRLQRMGEKLQNRFAAKGGSFAQGFVTASLIYCVGAMAIVGALEDGLAGNSSTLFAKSILDGVISIVLASSLGIGVAFSAIPVLIYQGFITLAATSIKPWLTNDVIVQMSLVGSILIFGIGINLLEIKEIKVGNLLPAIFIPFLYYIFIFLTHLT